MNKKVHSYKLSVKGGCTTKYGLKKTNKESIWVRTNIYVWNFSYTTIRYLWVCRWVSFFCKPVQTGSRCHCRCHYRSYKPSKCLRRSKCEWEEDERTPEDLILSVFNPHLTTNSLELCGFWSGYKDEQVLLEVFGGKYVILKSFHLKLQNMHNLWTYISSGNIKYMPRE